MTETERALESVTRAIHGYNDFGGAYDEATDTYAGEEYRFAEVAQLSKNGVDIIVRLTPRQALHFCDMIAEELD